MKNYIDKIFGSQNDWVDQLYGASNGTAGQGQGQSTTTGGTTIGGAGGAGTTITQQQLTGAAQQIFGGTLTPQQIQQMFAGYGVGLTPEEQKELDQLKIEHAAELKKAKLAVFKKLSPDLRQFVINALCWQELRFEMNNVSIDRSERLQELESKNAYKDMFGQTAGFARSAHTHSWYPGAIDPMASMLTAVGLPDGITAEELKEAHVEATLEEEMLNGEKES